MVGWGRDDFPHPFAGKVGFIISQIKFTHEYDMATDIIGQK